MSQDFFVSRNGRVYAGTHLIIDCYDAQRLNDIAHIEATLRQIVVQAGATLLHIHLHPFEVNGGISGVAVLAESHISVHTWPERGYGAFDVFMCGDANPHVAIDILKVAFGAGRVVVNDLIRGEVRDVVEVAQ